MRLSREGRRGSGRTAYKAIVRGSTPFIARKQNSEEPFTISTENAERPRRSRGGAGPFSRGLVFGRKRPWPPRGLTDDKEVKEGVQHHVSAVASSRNLAVSRRISQKTHRGSLEEVGSRLSLALKRKPHKTLQRRQNHSPPDSTRKGARCAVVVFSLTNSKATLAGASAVPQRH